MLAGGQELLWTRRVGGKGFTANRCNGTKFTNGFTCKYCDVKGQGSLFDKITLGCLSVKTNQLLAPCIKFGFIVRINNSLQFESLR